MKKLFKLCLATVLSACAVLASVGCSKENKDLSKTIVFYHTMSQSLQDVLGSQIQVFEAKYPGWKVEATQIGGYDDVRNAIISDLSSGTAPDLAYCYADHVAKYLPTGQVVDLKNLIYSTEKVVGANDVEYSVGYTSTEIADFVDSYYNEGKATNFQNYADYGYAEDSLLMLPFAGKSTELMYYNKSALDALHLQPATTWAELWEQCEIIKEAYPKCTPLGYDSDSNWFITTCAQNGWDYTQATGSHYLFNNTNVKNWMTEIKGYYDLGYIETQNTYGTYTSGLFTLGVENDAAGCVYCIGSSGGASHQNHNGLFEYGIAPIPGSKAISQGPSIVLFRGNLDNADEKVKMTFLFLKEILEPSFQASFSDASGYAPSRKSTYNIPAYAAKLDEQSNITYVAAALCKDLSLRDNYFFSSPAFDGSTDARENVGTAMKYVLSGEKTPEQALSDAVRFCGGE